MLPLHLPTVTHVTAARINFYRCGSWRDSARPYRVWIDDQPVGNLSPEGALTVDLEPGSHRLRARARWLGGGEHTVDVADAERIWVLVAPAAGFDLRRLASPARWLTFVIE